MSQRTRTLDMIRSGKLKHVISGKSEELFREVLAEIGLVEGKDYIHQFVLDDDFVADFGFIDKKLLIEIDGTSHRGKQKREQDRERDYIARSKGWFVLRVKESNLVKSTSYYKFLIKEVLDL